MHIIIRKMKQDFEKMLHGAGLKSTSPRLSVLKALSEMKRPETVQEIHKRLKKIDLVTLYRTLASFEEKKIVKRVDLRKDAVYYELNTNHHHHVICTNCDKVEDFESKEVERALKQSVGGLSKFGDIKSHSLEFFGLCNACVKS